MTRNMAGKETQPDAHQNAVVGCAGILVADTFCGPLPAMPRQGELIAVDELPVRPGGCAANVAIDLSKQGFRAEAAGCVGRDADGRLLLECLNAHGVGIGEVVQRDHLPTSKTVVLLIDGEDRRYIHSFGANRAFAVDQIRREWLLRLKLFYLGGLFALPGIEIEALRDILAFCRANGVVTVLDVVAPPDGDGMRQLALLLPHLDYFMPNDDEARRLTGESEPIDQLRAFADRGAHTVVVTRGPAGSIASRDGQFWSASAYPMASIDPSGAGDAFASGIIAGILRGWEMERMLSYAAAVGGSAARAIGTTDGVFSAAEADAFVAAHRLRIETGRFP
jgi:sugar/nucleoside kinase (ribokinase family)